MLNRRNVLAWLGGLVGLPMVAKAGECSNHSIGTPAQAAQLLKALQQMAPREYPYLDFRQPLDQSEGRHRALLILPFGDCYIEDVRKVYGIPEEVSIPFQHIDFSYLGRERHIVVEHPNLPLVKVGERVPFIGAEELKLIATRKPDQLAVGDKVRSLLTNYKNYGEMEVDCFADRYEGIPRIRTIICKFPCKVDGWSYDDWHPACLEKIS